MKRRHTQSQRATFLKRTNFLQISFFRPCIALSVFAVCSSRFIGGIYLVCWLYLSEGLSIGSFILKISKPITALFLICARTFTFLADETMAFKEPGA
jgi:hypothetical protein